MQNVNNYAGAFKRAEARQVGLLGVSFRSRTSTEASLRRGMLSTRSTPTGPSFHKPPRNTSWRFVLRTGSHLYLQPRTHRGLRHRPHHRHPSHLVRSRPPLLHITHPPLGQYYFRRGPRRRRTITFSRACRIPSVDSTTTTIETALQTDRLRRPSGLALLRKRPEAHLVPQIGPLSADIRKIYPFATVEGLVTI